MSRTLGNGDVELELGTGTWTARWESCGIVLGPCRADVDCLEWDTERRNGAWRVETTRTGARARWTWADDSAWLELRLPAEGTTIEVQMGYMPAQDDWVRGLVPLAGGISPALSRQLVNGYDSWSYSGVRAADTSVAEQNPGPDLTADGTDSYWSTTFTNDAGGVAIQALTSERYCTRITRFGTGVSVRSELTPTHHLVDGSWGHENRASSESWPVAAGEEIVSEPIAIAAGPDPLAVTEQVAGLLPRRSWNGPPALGWESWYYYATRISTGRLRENALLLREHFGDRPGFNLLQIDDGWQEANGAWWPRERFPRDFTEEVAKIHELGQRCGLWLAPFMVEPGATGLGTDHQDWCIRDETTGTTLLDRHQRWALDASNPEVVDYFRELGAQVRAWGVDMVKLDFLYQGAQEGVRHNPRVTGVQALRRGLGAFVDQLGEDVYVLGCGAPMLPMVGICHANRIGHDLSVPVLGRVYGQPLADGWTGWKGIKAQARQAVARFALHGRWFHNDPEIVMAWGSDGRGAGESDGDDGYSLEEAHTQAVVAALVGGPFLFADQLSTLLPEEWEVLEDAEVLDLAWDERGFRPVDLFAHADTGRQHAYDQPEDLPSVWVAERGTGTVVALFNWTDEPALRIAPDGAAREVPAHGVRLIH